MIHQNSHTGITVLKAMHIVCKWQFNPTIVGVMLILHCAGGIVRRIFVVFPWIISNQ